MCKMAQPPEELSKATEVIQPDPLLLEELEVSEWAATTAEAIRQMELRCESSCTVFCADQKPEVVVDDGELASGSDSVHSLSRGNSRSDKARPKSDSCVEEEEDNAVDPLRGPRRSMSEEGSLETKSPSVSTCSSRNKQLTVSFSGLMCVGCGFPDRKRRRRTRKVRRQISEPSSSDDCEKDVVSPSVMQSLELPLENLRFIDDSSKSSLSTVHMGYSRNWRCASPTPSTRSCCSMPEQSSIYPKNDLSPLSVPQSRMSPKTSLPVTPEQNEHLPYEEDHLQLQQKHCEMPPHRSESPRDEKQSQDDEDEDEDEYESSSGESMDHTGHEPQGKWTDMMMVSMGDTEMGRVERQSGMNDMDKQSVYSLYIERDFRYFFQHPYARLFVSYFVIFCNFLVFAEDPVSHSHTESEIPVVGNVFSFVATKYPPELTWVFIKVLLWLAAILFGLIFGKYIIHHIVLRNLCRLKMFRDEQGTWMIMLLTCVMSIYIFSNIYNFFLRSHPRYETFAINSQMGITNANFMKAAACGTWLGDFVTAWMVTDMMLQDNIYSDWARPFRRFWKSHTRTRICIFWGGAIFMTSLVVALIVSDYISWDRLNRDFVATNELSRAFLASFILVFDLLIVMQDWDFPHFVCDLDIKLPGMHVASFKFNLFKKYVNIPDVMFHFSGKWFNYGIIVIVMILDLNMWKNQIFYSPEEYGQYVGPDLKVHTVNEYHTLATGNTTLWSYNYRSTTIDPKTNQSFTDGDMQMNSRYLDYPMAAKGMAFIPSLLGFVVFGLLSFVYGRFPPKTDETAGGRLKKRKREAQRSSWRRERTASYNRQAYAGSSSAAENENKRKWVLRGGRRLTDIVVAWNQVYGSSANNEKPL